jgi:hypothetical protein
MENLQIKKLNGREVGSLSQNEFWLFEAACRDNKASRVYEGPKGFAGKAKVKIYASPK